MSTYILGISAFYHDSAACLVHDGIIVAAAQEERFTRKKHDAEFPHRAVDYCLREAGIGVEDLRCIGFYDKPLLTFERLLETHLATAPLGIRLFWKSMVVWIKKNLWIPHIIQDELKSEVPVLFGEHHESKTPVLRVDGSRAFSVNRQYASLFGAHILHAIYVDRRRHAPIALRSS